jgi:hypothetical protein
MVVAADIVAIVIVASEASSMVMKEAVFSSVTKQILVIPMATR